MAGAFQFELVSPERLLLSEEATEVVVPGTEGEFGIMAGHAAMMSTMRPGLLRVVRAAGGTERYFTRGGFAEVGPKGLTVLAETAVPIEELKADEIASQIRDAEEDVRDAKDEASREKAATVLQQLREVETVLKAL